MDALYRLSYAGFLSKHGAGDGNRTHVISLEGWSSTIELHPHINSLTTSIILVEGGGFEPPKAEPSDLQSDPFGRSGTPPRKNGILRKSSAHVNYYVYLILIMLANSFSIDILNDIDGA
jgi:hypothetical protein